jgi:hypothetical protein
MHKITSFFASLFVQDQQWRQLGAPGPWARLRRLSITIVLVMYNNALALTSSEC